MDAGRDSNPVLVTELPPKGEGGLTEKSDTSARDGAFSRHASSYGPTWEADPVAQELRGAVHGLLT